MFAVFVNSRVTGVGGWHVAPTKEDAVSAAEGALEVIPAKFRGLHSLGGVVEVTGDVVAWALGGGKSVLEGHPIYLHGGLDIKPADVSRGTGGWDFRNIEGLV